MKPPVRLALAAVPFLLLLDTAQAATVAVETTVGLAVGSYLGSGPYTNDEETHAAAGAIGLTAHQTISLGNPPVSTFVEASTDLTFVDTTHGRFHLDWVNRADIPNGGVGSGGQVLALPVPASTYNNVAQDKAMATYAFTIGGDGAVTIDIGWTSTLNDPQYSGALADFVFKGLKTFMVDVFQYRAGQGVGLDGTGLQKLRSTGDMPFVFNGQAGDVFVLHFLPKYLVTQDGARVNSKLSSSVDINFAVSAPGGTSPVPLPPTGLPCASGAVWAGMLARRRRRERGAHHASRA